MRPLITWLDRHFEFGLSFAGFIGAVCGAVYSTRQGWIAGTGVLVFCAIGLYQCCMAFSAPKGARSTLEQGSEGGEG